MCTYRVFLQSNRRPWVRLKCLVFPGTILLFWDPRSDHEHMKFCVLCAYGHIHAPLWHFNAFYFPPETIICSFPPLVCSKVKGCCTLSWKNNRLATRPMTPLLKLIVGADGGDHGDALRNSWSGLEAVWRNALKVVKRRNVECPEQMEKGTPDGCSAPCSTGRLPPTLHLQRVPHSLQVWSASTPSADLLCRFLLFNLQYKTPKSHKEAHPMGAGFWKSPLGPRAQQLESYLKPESCH